MRDASVMLGRGSNADHSIQYILSERTLDKRRTRLALVLMLAAMKMLPGIRQFDLSGRCALITGGSKGLGKAMALGLASAGAEVMLVSRHRAEAEEAAGQVAAEFGCRAFGFQADVASSVQVEAMIQQALAAFGKIDILINSAGIANREAFEQVAYEDFQEVQRVNVHGTWLCCRTVTPHMKRAGYGRIINIASTLGLIGLANRAAYACSKGAVVQMTRAAAVELAKFGIAVNAICPGPFLTDMNRNSANSEEGKRLIARASPIRRRGEPKEIQGAAILLASEAASYMAGSLLVVDGGWIAR